MNPLEVRSATDWEVVQETLDFFHDSVLDSLSFQNDQVVEPSGSMLMSRGEAIATVTIRTQSTARPGGRITFNGVHSVRHDEDRDIEPGVVEPVFVRGRGELLRFEFGSCEIVAAYALVEPL